MGSRGHVRESLPWCWGVEEAPCVAPSLPGASEFPRRRLGDIRSILLGGNFLAREGVLNGIRCLFLRAGKKDPRKLKSREGAPRVSCLKPHSWVLAGSRLNATIPCHLDPGSFR